MMNFSSRKDENVGFRFAQPNLRAADKFINGTGVTVDQNGILNGVSVNSAANKSLKELTAGIPHNKVGTTTVGDVRAAGGNVVASPTKSNPNHATLSGITPAKAETLMKPTVPNPSVKR